MSDPNVPATPPPMPAASGGNRITIDQSVECAVSLPTLSIIEQDIRICAQGFVARMQARSAWYQRFATSGSVMLTLFLTLTTADKFKDFAGIPGSTWQAVVLILLGVSLLIFAHAAWKFLRCPEPSVAEFVSDLAKLTRSKRQP